MRKLIKAPSPSMIVAMVALFVALGGSAYAIGKNSVGTKQLKKNAVTTKKIKNSAVDGSKVKDGSLKALDLGAGQLPNGAAGACAGACATLTNTYALMGTTATVTTTAGGRLSAFGAAGVYQLEPLVGTSSEAQCRLEASGTGISGRVAISQPMWEEVYEQFEDGTISLVGSRRVDPGTFTVGVYCLGVQAPTEATRIFNVDLVALVTG